MSPRHHHHRTDDDYGVGHYRQENPVPFKRVISRVIFPDHEPRRCWLRSRPPSWRRVGTILLKGLWGDVRNSLQYELVEVCYSSMVSIMIWCEIMGVLGANLSLEATGEWFRREIWKNYTLLKCKDNSMLTKWGFYRYFMVKFYEDPET